MSKTCIQTFEEIHQCREKKERKAEIVAQEHPDCVCESYSVSKYSPGQVQDAEIVARLIFAPVHVERDTGLVKRAAVSDAKSRGMSVERTFYTTPEDLAERGREIATKNSSVEFQGALFFKAARVREIAHDQRQCFAIYDTAQRDNKAHGDVCQSYFPGKVTSQKVRAKLMNCAEAGEELVVAGNFSNWFS